ncbi:hypothetical protein NQ318_015163 [Aromia moschata]|uniref:Uncharacterized protein n=1 Tax=Aromia moschata TaxID=1265417 RepID=A0AAV8XWZ5_9CUCU|nr:hypothetical protein NQ318_015163 [Aromia moschata]
MFIPHTKGRETSEDDPRPGRPSTSKTDENIENIGKLIREDRRLSIRGFSEITRIDKECVSQIWHESFNMRKVCAKMVPICYCNWQRIKSVMTAVRLFNSHTSYKINAVDFKARKISLFILTRTSKDVYQDFILFDLIGRARRQDPNEVEDVPSRLFTEGIRIELELRDNGVRKVVVPKLLKLRNKRRGFEEYENQPLNGPLEG